MLYGAYVAAASRCLRAVWPSLAASHGAQRAAAFLHYTLHAILVALVALHRFEVVDVQRPQYTNTFWLAVFSMLAVLRRDAVFIAPLMSRAAHAPFGVSALAQVAVFVALLLVCAHWLCDTLGKSPLEHRIRAAMLCVDILWISTVDWLSVAHVLASRCDPARQECIGAVDATALVTAASAVATAALVVCVPNGRRAMQGLAQGKRL